MYKEVGVSFRLDKDEVWQVSSSGGLIIAGLPVWRINVPSLAAQPLEVESTPDTLLTTGVGSDKWLSETVGPAIRQAATDCVELLELMTKHAPPGRPVVLLNLWLLA